MKNISTDKIILGLVGTITLAAVILIILFSANEQKNLQGKTLIASYKVEDTDKPKVEVDKTYQDIGKMKVKDEKTASFTIKNIGNKPLSLSKVSSSCDCTFGQITINTEKSPEFGMHSKSTWSGNIEPGKTAVVDVIYKPYIMPVSGSITRDVYVQTNDPANPNLTFTVKAFVE
ncbi:DUF1573 domain-containing protein [Candidatus Gottesmanbacteria bacterium]|nr:DUF1573 domain-containing protein [Candidatus Gottesmanbacteria bacterium]